MPAYVMWELWETRGWPWPLALGAAVLSAGVVGGLLLERIAVGLADKPPALRVVATVGILIFAAALYGSIYPVPVYPLNMTPYLALTWVMFGLFVVGTMRTRRPATVKRIGSILGEEGA